MPVATLSTYDVECDWYLLVTCNYRCGYCFLSPDALGSKLQRFASPETWAAAFAATKKRWLIHMTGGEPTLYPEFVDLCELLTRDQVISINSNLSRQTVRSLAGRVDPLRVSFINAGIHIAERVRHRGITEFLANARILQDAGFRVIVTAVATPDVIAQIAELSAHCAAAGLHLAPKVLRGTRAGKKFPSAYSEAERISLRSAITRAREYYAGRYSGWPAPSINVLDDDALLDGIPDFRGRMCGAGFRFVRINQNGDVYRCGGSVPEFGNILDGTMRLNSEPALCDRGYCVYFCQKYSIDVTPAPETGARRQPESV